MLFQHFQVQALSLQEDIIVVERSVEKFEEAAAAAAAAEERQVWSSNTHTFTFEACAQFDAFSACQFQENKRTSDLERLVAKDLDLLKRLGRLFSLLLYFHLASLQARQEPCC